MKRFSAISSIIALTVVLAACGEKTPTPVGGQPVAAAQPAQQFDLNPTQGVARDPKVTYSDEDCENLSTMFASMQRLRNSDGPISIVEENLAEIKANHRALYAELMDVANNIWRKPVNLITPEQAGSYAIDFCNAPAARV
jgi:predicted small lipoprotein YifL